MGKLKTERITVRETDHDDCVIHSKDSMALDFKIDINVTADGGFTAKLPDDVVKMFTDAGLVLRTNGRRNGKPGFFESNTYADLMKQIKDACEDYVSKELISEKIVIHYIIETTCSYMIYKGDFIPNGSCEFRPDDKFDDYKWIGGTVNMNTAHPRPFGFRIWTDVLFKREYRYKSGKTRIFFDSVHDDDLDIKKQPYLHWLQGIVSISEPEDHKPQEMDYTEDTAKFFVDMYKAIFRINERLKDQITPEAIKLIIENKQKLLG